MLATSSPRTDGRTDRRTDRRRKGSGGGGSSSGNVVYRLDSLLLLGALLLLLPGTVPGSLKPDKAKSNWEISPFKSVFIAAAAALSRSCVVVVGGKRERYEEK